MTDGPPTRQQKVVLMPDAFGKSFSDPANYRLLELWRDGRIQLVVSRWLLVRYLRLLSRLGSPPDVFRWWSWWFTSPLKVRYLDEPVSISNPIELCAELARQAGAHAVIHTHFTPSPEQDGNPETVPWIHAAEFLKRFDPDSRG